MKALSYVISAKGEKHIWFEGHLYQKHRENKWPCVVKGCNGRLSTTGSDEGETIFNDVIEHSCKPVTFQGFLCKRALSRVKERIKSEVHVALSAIYSDDIKKLVEVDKLDQATIGLFLKDYSFYKNTLLKSRIGIKPPIPQNLFDLNFEGENFKFSQKIDAKCFL